MSKIPPNTFTVAKLSKYPCVTFIMMLWSKALTPDCGKIGFTSQIRSFDMTVRSLICNWFHLCIPTVYPQHVWVAEVEGTEVTSWSMEVFWGSSNSGENSSISTILGLTVVYVQSDRKYPLKSNFSGQRLYRDLLVEIRLECVLGPICKIIRFLFFFLFLFLSAKLSKLNLATMWMCQKRICTGILFCPKRSLCCS